MEGGSLKSNPADFPSCLPGPFSREKWTFFTSLFLSNFQFKSRILLFLYKSRILLFLYKSRILLFDTRIKRPNRIFRLQMTTCLLYFKKAFYVFIVGACYLYVLFLIFLYFLAVSVLCSCCVFILLSFILNLLFAFV